MFILTQLWICKLKVSVQCACISFMIWMVKLYLWFLLHLVQNTVTIIMNIKTTNAYYYFLTCDFRRVKPTINKNQTKLSYEWCQQGKHFTTCCLANIRSRSLDLTVTAQSTLIFIRQKLQVLHCANDLLHQFVVFRCFRGPGRMQLLPGWGEGSLSDFFPCLLNQLDALDDVKCFLPEFADSHVGWKGSLAGFKDLLDEISGVEFLEVGDYQQPKKRLSRLELFKMICSLPFFAYKRRQFSL